MFHSKRRWRLSEVASADQLAAMLSQVTWTLCSAFYVRGHDQYLFLNDATHEDGAGEYAVTRRLPDGTFVQVESITFSWTDRATALRYVQDALAGKFDQCGFVRPVQPRLDAPEHHRPCDFCA